VPNPDLHFYFDPVCPFAWMTSKWVRSVSAQRQLTVDWRLISLRQLNARIDYAAHFPPGYEAGHTAGLRLLRVAARTRQTLGREAVGTLYAALGAAVFDSDPLPEGPGDDGLDLRGTAAFVGPVLSGAGLPASLVEALDDAALDEEIRTETEEALTLTGRDVGTPIIHVDPPSGTAFFGPVISRLPGEREALELWDHVVGLARFPGFAELKRSLREQPQLRGLGVADAAPGAVEDWHAGSRRTEH
jgi:2-hydroxychromene-2-carboxylate isomerase